MSGLAAKFCAGWSRRHRPASDFILPRTREHCNFFHNVRKNVRSVKQELEQSVDNSQSMEIEPLCLRMGQAWGRGTLKWGVAYLQWRGRQLDLTVRGERHLAAMAGQCYLLVSNHIVPSSSPLAPLPHLPYLPQYHHSADSFLFRRAVQERTGDDLHTVAKCDRGEWWAHPGLRRLQRRLVQPFVWGQIAAVPGYIPLECNPGAGQRRFLKALAEVVRRRNPILIFPGQIHSDGSRAQTDPRAGAPHIALKYELPILPACIIGSDTWRFGQPVTIAFGEAFAPARLNKSQVREEIACRVQALLAEYVDDHRRRPDIWDGERY